MIICSECGRDIDAIGQDNMSPSLRYALCEDCAQGGMVCGCSVPDESYSFTGEYHKANDLPSV